MASTGIKAWQKYFEGNLPLKTTTKKTSNLYHCDTKKTIGSIDAGVEVEVLQADYNSKTLIRIAEKKEYLQNKCRISFSSLNKPISLVKRINLYPQSFFDVSISNYSYKDYVKQLYSSLRKRKDIPEEIKSYLNILAGHYTRKVPLTNITELYNSNKVNINPYKKVIIKAYGEVLGPIAILKNDLLKQLNISFDIDKSSIIITNVGNEPLVDYFIEYDKLYSFSAKANSGGTNLVKANDIYNNISKFCKSKYKYDDRFKILGEISSNNTIQGPGMVGTYLSRCGMSDFNGLTKESVAEIFHCGDPDIKIDTDSIHEFMSNHNLEQNLTMGELYYYIEKMVIKTLNDNFDFTPVFSRTR